MASKQHKLFWGSSYDRGLDTLLFMWPDVLEKYPDAELHICYGWDLFIVANRSNPERMQWKEQVEQLMKQKGIKHYGRVGKEKLKKVRKACGIWAYPTWFPEINCITALECQRDGCVPVTMNNFALRETVGSGVKIDGDIKTSETMNKYLEELLGLMGDKKRWRAEQLKGQKFAKEYYWKNIASKWVGVFKEPVGQPLVSVITPTIREGWWNIMSRNLADQTYKNFEWIILDDHKEDRKGIADKYAEEYGLNIRYIRGDKALGKYKRKHGLARANNKAWKESKGELLVFIQDFIMIPKTGLESLVDLYRHNPDALLAPVDQYWHPKQPDKTNREDWWDSDLHVIDGFSWRNVRVQFKGIRETDNPFDFEMNYSAIPKHILDHLNGWYEFFDDALGYDNTEIAYRALQEGYRIIIDDTNVATCIDLGSNESDPITWEKFKKGGYPAVRKGGQ